MDIPDVRKRYEVVEEVISIFQRQANSQPEQTDKPSRHPKMIPVEQLELEQGIPLKDSYPSTLTAIQSLIGHNPKAYLEVVRIIEENKNS